MPRADAAGNSLADAAGDTSAAVPRAVCGETALPAAPLLFSPARACYDGARDDVIGRNAYGGEVSASF